jgi:hypothetical protein
MGKDNKTILYAINLYDKYMYPLVEEELGLAYESSETLFKTHVESMPKYE